MANATLLPNLAPLLSQIGNTIIPLLPQTAVNLALNGAPLYAAGMSAHKFAYFPDQLPFNVPADFPDFPAWFKVGYADNMNWLISTVASYCLPSVLGNGVATWIASALVQVYIMKLAFIVVFFPWFGFYRAADRWGFLDKWKTLPHKENPDKAKEAEIWAAFFPSVLYPIPSKEALVFWLIYYSRGEITLNYVPPLAVVLAKVAFTIFAVDTMYFWFHWLEHQPSLYQKLHKAHHEIKISNVYGFFYVTPLEHYIQAHFGVIVNTLLAWTVGQDLVTMLLWAAYGLSMDLHIHCGYTVPWIPFNWWNPQYFHAFHHSQNKGNYGAFFGIPLLAWDWWMGTDKNWRRYRESGGEVRLHRNTWPGFAVPGDLDKKSKDD